MAALVREKESSRAHEFAPVVRVREDSLAGGEHHRISVATPCFGHEPPCPFGSPQLLNDNRSRNDALKARGGPLILG